MDKPMLGDYRIEGIVGVGRMGVVYLAIDRITGRAVALKVLRDDVSIDPVYRERFRRGRGRGEDGKTTAGGESGARHSRNLVPGVASGAGTPPPRATTTSAARSAA